MSGGRGSCVSSSRAARSAGSTFPRSRSTRTSRPSVAPKTGAERSLLLLFEELSERLHLPIELLLLGGNAEDVGEDSDPDDGVSGEEVAHARSSSLCSSSTSSRVDS